MENIKKEDGIRISLICFPNQWDDWSRRLYGLIKHFTLDCIFTIDSLRVEQTRHAEDNVT